MAARESKEKDEDVIVISIDGVKEENCIEQSEDSDISNISELQNNGEGISDDYIYLQSEPGQSTETLPTPRKKRTINLEDRKKNKRKRCRNSGQSYSNKSGNIIQNREMGPACYCNKNCRTLLEGTELNLFNMFWELGSYDLQNEYLFNCMKAVPPKRRYPKKTKKESSGRKITIAYFVKVNGEDVKICKNEFLAVHGLQNSAKRIQLLTQQIAAGRTTPKKDQRGKHQNRANRIQTDPVQLLEII